MFQLVCFVLIARNFKLFEMIKYAIRYLDLKYDAQMYLPSIHDG
jgi:hypothetical protein